MKYNRASIDDTIDVARKQAEKSNQIKHVFATAYGFTISDKVPYWQRYYRIYPGGKVCLMSGNY